MWGSLRFLFELPSNTQISIINTWCKTLTVELGVMPHVVLKILIATSASFQTPL